MFKGERIDEHGEYVSSVWSYAASLCTSSCPSNAPGFTKIPIFFFLLFFSLQLWIEINFDMSIWWSVLFGPILVYCVFLWLSSCNSYRFRLFGECSIKWFCIFIDKRSLRKVLYDLAKNFYSNIVTCLRAITFYEFRLGTLGISGMCRTEIEFLKFSLRYSCCQSVAQIVQHVYVGRLCYNQF